MSASTSIESSIGSMISTMLKFFFIPPKDSESIKPPKPVLISAIFALQPIFRIFIWALSVITYYVSISTLPSISLPVPEFVSHLASIYQDAVGGDAPLSKTLGGFSVYIPSILAALLLSKRISDPIFKNPYLWFNDLIYAYDREVSYGLHESGLLHPDLNTKHVTLGFPVFGSKPQSWVIPYLRETVGNRADDFFRTFRFSSDLIQRTNFEFPILQGIFVFQGIFIASLNLPIAIDLMLSIK